MTISRMSGMEIKAKSETQVSFVEASTVTSAKTDA
jgi:hypothetical protein